MKFQDTLLVSIVGDLLVIGRKTTNKPVDIVNAIQGEEAIKLYKELITKKEIEISKN